jgi:hypothetical protein
MTVSYIFVEQRLCLADRIAASQDIPVFYVWPILQKSWYSEAGFNLIFGDSTTFALNLVHSDICFIQDETHVPQQWTKILVTFFLNIRPSRLKIRWRLRFLYRFEGDRVIDLSEVHGNILYNTSNLLITQHLQNVYSSALFKIFTSNLYRTVYRSANGSSYTSLSI